MEGDGTTPKAIRDLPARARTLVMVSKNCLFSDMMMECRSDGCVGEDEGVISRCSLAVVYRLITTATTCDPALDASRPPHRFQLVSKKTHVRHVIPHPLNARPRSLDRHRRP